MIAVALLVAASLLVVWFSSDDMFYIRSIKIAGNLRVPDTELIKTTGLGGINVFWVETQAAEKALQALPDVMSARVRCTLPADCAINLVERPVLFVWRQGDAHAWIATDGTVLPARGAMADAVVLDAAGSAALKPGDRLDSNLVLAVQELARLQPQVREYTYSDRYGLIFRDSQDWTIRLGHGEQTAVKLELLRALTTFFVEQSIEPTLVDVRYPDAPYYIE